MWRPLFERFLLTTTMLDAEQELIEMGAQAVPILKSLLNGEAKNAFGVPYRELGLPLRCALETARRLDGAAKPLESLLANEVANGHPTAAMALGSLGTLNQISIESLANALDGHIELAFESAAALSRCRELDNKIVLNKISQSDRAALIVGKFLDNQV
jgi:hypothetical protein